jgi:hypothetical protein
MIRGKLIDVVLRHAEAAQRDKVRVDRDTASAVVDDVLDAIIRETGSPRTVDELTRIKNGA